MPLNRTHPFKSEKTRERYLARYEMRAAEWPIPSVTRRVDTSFGETFVRVSGPADGDPVVMLPGIGSPGYTFSANAEALSERFRTYAVDNIHDNGRSVETHAVTSAEDFVKWLDEVATGLELGDSINLVGLSYGGWIAVHYALRYSARVSRLVLLAPAGTVAPIPWGFIWRGILAILPLRYPIRSMMKWVAPDLNGDPESRQQFDDLVEDAFVAQRCFRPRRMVPPIPLTDEQWQSLSVPTVLLVGEREVIFNPQRALMRLSSVAPQVRTELIPNVGHDFFIARADDVNRRVLSFLEKTSIRG